MLDGKPVGGAKIQFQPIANESQNGVSGPGSYAVTAADGTYALKLVTDDRDGAVTGRHRVYISTGDVVDPTTSDAGILTGERMPDDYVNGRVEFTVPADGTSQADFNAKSEN